MKINGISGPGYVQGKNKIINSSAIEKYSTNQGGDKVSISEEAMNFSKVFAAAKQDSGIRETEIQSRIDTIKEQIENGTYSVSSEDIADRIIGDLYF